MFCIKVGNIRVEHRINQGVEVAHENYDYRANNYLNGFILPQGYDRLRIKKIHRRSIDISSS